MNIFDDSFGSLPNQYRAWVFPDLYPNKYPARLENWSESDLEMYCGPTTRKETI